MKMTLRLFLPAFLVVFAGCSIQPAGPRVDPSALVRFSEAKPQGFPKAQVEQQGTNCALIVEDWEKDEYAGHIMWQKVKRFQMVTCPASSGQ